MTNEDAAFPLTRREGSFEREPARRVFAGELRESRIHFKEGQDEKEPIFRSPPDRCPL